MFLLVEWNESPKEYSIINANRVKKLRIDGKEVEAFINADCIPAVEVYVRWYRSNSYWATIISTGDKDSLNLQLENITLDGEVGTRGLKRLGHSGVSKEKAVDPTLPSMQFSEESKKSVQRSPDQTLLSEGPADTCDPNKATMSSQNRKGKRLLKRDPEKHRDNMMELRRELCLLEDKLRTILITAGFDRAMVTSRRQIDEACCGLLEKLSEEFKEAIPEYVSTRTCSSKRHSKHRIRHRSLPTTGEAFTTAPLSQPGGRLASTNMANSDKSSNPQQVDGINCSPNSLTKLSSICSRYVSDAYPAKIQSPPSGNSSVATSSSPDQHGTRSHIDTDSTGRGSAVHTQVNPVPAHNRHFVGLEPCHYPGRSLEQAGDVLLHTEPGSFTPTPHCEANGPAIHSFPSMLPFALNTDAVEPQYSSIANATRNRENNTSDIGHRTTTNECTTAYEVAHPKQLINPLLFEALDDPPFSKGELSSVAISRHHMKGSDVCSGHRRLGTSAHTEFVQDDRAATTLASEATPLDVGSSCQVNKLPIQRAQKEHTARWEMMSCRYDGVISAYCGYSDDAQTCFLHQSCNAMTNASTFRPPGTCNNGVPATTAQFGSPGLFDSSHIAHSSTSFTGLRISQFAQDYRPMIDDGAAMKIKPLASDVRLEENSTGTVATPHAAVDYAVINGGKHSTTSNGANNTSNREGISLNGCHDDNNSNSRIHNNNNSNNDINQSSQSMEPVQRAAICHAACSERTMTTLSGSEVYEFFNALSPKATIIHENLAHGDQCSDTGASGGSVVNKVLAGTDDAPIPPTTLQSCITAAAEGCKSYGTAIVSQTATVLQKAITENELYKKCRCSLLTEGDATKRGNSAITCRMPPEQAWCALEGNGNRPVDVFTCL